MELGICFTPPAGSGGKNGMDLHFFLIHSRMGNKKIPDGEQPKIDLQKKSFFPDPPKTNLK